MNRTPIPSVIKRNTLLFMTGQALYFCVSQVVVILSALVVFALTGSVALGGLATAIVLGSRVLIVYHTGRLMDRVGRKTVLFIGVMLGCLALFLMGWAIFLSWVEIYWLGLFVFGLGSGVIQQNRIAIMDMYPATRRGEGMGYLMTASIVGSFLSPIFITTMAPISAFIGLNHYMVLILVSILLLASSAFFIKLVRPDTKDIAQSLENYYPDTSLIKSDQKVIPNEGSFLRSVLVFPIVASFIASALAWGDMSMNMSIVSLVLHQHNVELTLISLSISLHVFGMFGLSVPLGWLTDRLGRKLVTMLGGIILGVGAFLMPVSSSYLIISFAIFLVGLGWSAVNVATTAIISDLTPSERRGRMFGANDVATGLASLALPTIGGAILSSIGPFALAISGLIFALLVFSITFPIHERAPGTYDI